MKKTFSTSEIIHKIFPYLLLAPALIYLGAFIGYPLIQASLLAFKNPDTGRFSLVVFKTLAKDSYFHDALLYTFLLAAVIIPIQVTIAILVALFLSREFKGRDAVLYIFSIPLAISDVAAGLIWYNIFASSGYLNKLLLKLGIITKPIEFFGYAYRSREFLTIVVTEVWRATAIVFIIIFAGMQLISKDYLEAAEICGASGWQKFRYIIFPLLKPSLQAALIIRTIFALQVFATVWVLAGRDIPVLAGEAYYQLAEVKNPNIASAYALIITALSILLGIMYLKLFKPEYLEVEK